MKEICSSCLELAFSVQIWLSVGCSSQGLCYSPDSDKLKSVCDNLEAVYSSNVDGKQLYKILDCAKCWFQVIQLKIIAS